MSSKKCYIVVIILHSDKTTINLALLQISCKFCWFLSCAAFSISCVNWVKINLQNQGKKTYNYGVNYIEIITLIT